MSSRIMFECVVAGRRDIPEGTRQLFGMGRKFGCTREDADALYRLYRKTLAQLISSMGVDKAEIYFFVLAWEKHQTCMRRLLSDNAIERDEKRALSSFQSTLFSLR